jgi:hypothetical protein
MPFINEAIIALESVSAATPSQPYAYADEDFFLALTGYCNKGGHRHYIEAGYGTPHGPFDLGRFVSPGSGVGNPNSSIH